jgi:hypothetical protein
MGRKAGGTKFGPGSQARGTFLTELAATGRFYDSCTVAQVCYTTMQKFRDPASPTHDPAFVEQVEEALACYSDKLRSEVHRRGVEGWVERGQFGKDGVHLGDVHRYSDRLLELHIKRHDPAYRDHVRVDADVKGKVRSQHSVDLEGLLAQAGPDARGLLRRTIQAFMAGQATSTPAPDAAEGV